MAHEQGSYDQVYSNTVEVDSNGPEDFSALEKSMGIFNLEQCEQAYSL